ncbi:MAG: diacylglycerol/lipid kinase family protein [Thermoanaerobaculia bacterium]
MSGENVRFLVNPSAGGSAGRRALPAIRSGLPRGARLVVSRDGAHLAAEARRAVDERVDRLVVAGGDGTFHLVVPALVGGSTCLGLVPVGRGNDFATSLGVPAAVPEAVELALTGRERLVDVGRAGEHRFAFYGGAGFDSAVSATADGHSRLLPSSITYVLATVRTLVRFRPPTAVVEWQGGGFEGELMFATVCNGPRFGGGMLIAPDAVMDDGLLDLVLVRRVSKPELLRVFPRVFRGTHIGHPAISIHRTPWVRMRFSPTALLGCDGEVLGPLPPAGIRFDLIPRALRVVSGTAV